MATFIDEIGSAAKLEADARGLKLIVLPVQDGLTVEVDEQILTAVVGNLLQNAFKFTRTHSAVTLRVHASADRVLIAVEDECGALREKSRGRNWLLHSSNVAPIERASVSASRSAVGGRSQWWPALCAKPAWARMRVYAFGL